MIIKSHWFHLHTCHWQILNLRKYNEYIYLYICNVKLLNINKHWIYFILQGDLPSTIHSDEALWTLGKWLYGYCIFFFFCSECVIVFIIYKSQQRMSFSLAVLIMGFFSLHRGQEIFKGVPAQGTSCSWEPLELTACGTVRDWRLDVRPDGKESYATEISTGGNPRIM